MAEIISKKDAIVSVYNNAVVDYERSKIVAKYYKSSVLPEMMLRKKEKKIGKAELDAAKSEVKDKEESLKNLKKIVDLIKESLDQLSEEG